MEKGIAQNIVYGAFDYVAEKTGEDALEVFYKALNNIMPVLEIKARRRWSNISITNRNKTRKKRNTWTTLVSNLL